MKNLKIEQALYEIIDQLTQQQGLELIELKVAYYNKDTLIQVLVDTPQGGIGISACTALNRSIVEAIDKEAILSEDGYSLEVSSPGLDRPLVTYKDFLRNKDREVHLWLKEKLDAKSEHIGIILGADKEIIKLYKTKEKKEITVPINLILKCLLVI